MKTLKFLAILIVVLVITWFAAEGIYWLSVLMKPMTHFGMLMERIFLHVAFGILSIYAAILFSE